MPSPIPGSEHMHLWSGSKGMAWAHSAAFPLCGILLKSFFLSCHQVPENMCGFLPFETDIAILGYTWSMVQKLLMKGRQTKSVHLWNDEEKAPTDRENEIKNPLAGELHDSIDKVRVYQRNW